MAKVDLVELELEYDAAHAEWLRATDDYTHAMEFANYVENDITIQRYTASMRVYEVRAYLGEKCERAGIASFYGFRKTHDKSL